MPLANRCPIPTGERQVAIVQSFDALSASKRPPLPLATDGALLLGVRTDTSGKGASPCRIAKPKLIPWR